MHIYPLSGIHMQMYACILMYVSCMHMRLPQSKPGYIRSYNVFTFLNFMKKCDYIRNVLYSR